LVTATLCCSHSFNPNDLVRDELREIRLSLDPEKENPERQSQAARHSQAAVQSPSVSFFATRNIRREAVPSNSSSGEIIIRLDQHKVKSVRHILSVRSGDGRRADSAVSESQPASTAPAVPEDNETEVVEEGHFSCLYWNSQQSARDAKLGTLFLTSDHISFESSSKTLMGCFVYDVSHIMRKHSQHFRFCMSLLISGQKIGAERGHKPRLILRSTLFCQFSLALAHADWLISSRSTTSTASRVLR
jgi:hypothetical protein